MKKDKATEALELSLKIQPLLHGLSPEMTGAVLADLVSLWLAGHQPRPGVSSKDALEAREVVLENWLKAVRSMIPINEEIVLAAVADGATAYEEQEEGLDRKPN